MNEFFQIFLITFVVIGFLMTVTKAITTLIPDSFTRMIIYSVIASLMITIMYFFVK